MTTDISTRMKDFYESRTRTFLPRRTYTIIRLDGKAFHTFTRGMAKPFDEGLIGAMGETSLFLCNQIQGVKFAYSQSDEISLLLTDFDNLQTNAWFDGNIQKIVSVSASFATAKFNEAISKYKDCPLAFFDSRVFTISHKEEVVNYFLWRQQDATRNSIQMVARSLYSQNECFNKNASQLQEMIFQKGQNWNDIPTHQKRGVCYKKYSVDLSTDDGDVVRRNIWKSDLECPIFSQNRNYILDTVSTE